MTELVAIATKLLLSGALTLMAMVFLWQTWRLWWSETLVLAPFDYLDAGKPSAESGETFARMVRAELVQLAGLYNAGEVANAGAVPSAGTHVPAVPMEVPAVLDTSFFDDIELRAYGVELGSILKSLRRRLESPSEITGSVTHQADKYSVFMELRQPGVGKDSLQRWSFDYAKSVPEATRNVACRIFRFLAGNATGAAPDAQLFRNVGDEDFCLFNIALAAYDQYRQRKAVLSEDEAKAVLAVADGPLANLVAREQVTFPYIHKLAALIFYEQKKYGEAELAIDRYTAWLKRIKRVDASADELRTSIASKKLQKTPAVSRLRPLQPGSSVGPLAAVPSGLICCFAKDAAGNRYLLSAVQALGSTADTSIVQPAKVDGGGQDDIVAVVQHVTPTFVVARIRDDVGVSPKVLGFGEIKGLEPKPVPTQKVIVFGLDGARRDGEVISAGVPVPVNMTGPSGPTQVQVDDGVNVTLSASAEVGAPVMTPEGKLVGMIFGTFPNGALVVPVDPVLHKLGLQLLM